uniref:sorting nexin-8-like n=1 Tax=Oncorhynchus gorbuscha TaxID=8017 RepID=UPI001EAF7494|nr:sorting nexin-8-like [Oncorhynchus gorbuscha]
MAGELNEGSVPPYYREVYEAIRSKIEERVQVEVFQRLLSRTDLPSAVQSQIAEHVDYTDGFLSKLSLYKALALIALAQQGKQPSPKLLENCIQGKPFNYSHFKISVYRRYTDFDVFHELLLQRFAYRMVPALPPKRMLKGVLTSMSERDFIEGRRRALGRFINLVARHPFFSEDELVKTFLTFNGSDVQVKMRDACKKMGDEFMTNTMATLAKDYLPADIQAQFSSSRELIRNIHNSFHKLRDRAEKMAERSKENATDLLMFGRELSTLGSDGSPIPSLASSQSTWGILRQSLKGLSVEFALLADKGAQQGRREEDDVVEKLNLFLDLLQSYRDLCERHEKGVLHEHQRALQKYGMMKRQMMSATVQPKEQVSVEQLESRIVQQENAIQTMELRNYFSLFCLHQETQLIFTYLPITSHILGAFVNSQVQGHQEMGAVWNDLQQKLGCLFGVDEMQSPPLTPK